MRSAYRAWRGGSLEIRARLRQLTPKGIAISVGVAALLCALPFIIASLISWAAVAVHEAEENSVRDACIYEFNEYLDDAAYRESMASRSIMTEFYGMDTVEWMSVYDDRFSWHIVDVDLESESDTAYVMCEITQPNFSEVIAWVSERRDDATPLDEVGKLYREALDVASDVVLTETFKFVKTNGQWAIDEAGDERIALYATGLAL